MNAMEILKRCGFASAAAVRSALSPAPAGSVVESRKDVCGGYDLPGRTHGYCPQAVSRYRILRDYNG